MSDDPTLGLTFEDLILRVAEHMGVHVTGSGAAAIPTDAHDLDLCKRLVNDGWRTFVSTRARWNWQLRPFSITFDSDGEADQCVASSPYRYYLPAGFYSLVGPITYADATGYPPMEAANEAEIRSLHAEADTSGYPQVYAVRRIHDDPRGLYELIVWPSPGSDLTVTGMCRVGRNKLVELTDRPACGPQFDECVLTFALAEAEQQREDLETTVFTQRAGDALKRAIAIDGETAPSSLGDFGRPERVRRRRVFTGVDTYTNLDGTVHYTE